jgi:hypothetical protein
MPFGGLLTTGILSVGSSILGGITQRNAAKKAGTQQVNAANDANRFATERAQESQASINDATGRANEGYRPYTEAGATGITKLAGMDPFSFSSANLADWQDPGYAFRLNQGNEALTRTAAARGGVLSGSTIKAGLKFNQDMASQEYQNSFERALTSYNTNASRYKDLAGFGLPAQDRVATNTMSDATQRAQINQDLSHLYSDNVLQRGNAEAASTIGAGNATSGIFTGIGQTAADVFNQYKTQQNTNRFMDLYKSLQPGAVAGK